MENSAQEIDIGCWGRHRPEVARLRTQVATRPAGIDGQQQDDRMPAFLTASSCNSDTDLLNVAAFISSAAKKSPRLPAGAGSAVDLQIATR